MGRPAAASLFDTLAWDGPTSDRDLHDFWARTRATAATGASHLLSVAMIERATGTYVGGASLRPVDGDPRLLDLGYAVAPRWHGRSFATEAVRALVDEAFANRGAERVFATIFVGNVASRRVVEKVGMRFEGTLRRVFCKRGVWMDEWLLAITRPDWVVSAPFGC